MMTMLIYWWTEYIGCSTSGLTGIKMNCSPNNGVRINAALTAFLTLSGAGFGEPGCIIVRMTRSILMRKTVK